MKNNDKLRLEKTRHNFFLFQNPNIFSIPQVAAILDSLVVIILTRQQVNHQLAIQT